MSIAFSFSYCEDQLTPTLVARRQATGDAREPIIDGSQEAEVHNKGHGEPGTQYS